MWRLFFCTIFFGFAVQLRAQPRSGTIKVRKPVSIQGLYVLEEGDYYKMKLYVRFFDNHAAVFLNAPLNPRQASDSTARLLYTYRKNPSVYRVVNDSLFIEGNENQRPFTYRGVVRDNRLRLRKYAQSAVKSMVFKKIL
jgi:hypothetical protein